MFSLFCSFILIHGGLSGLDDFEDRARYKMCGVGWSGGWWARVCVCAVGGKSCVLQADHILHALTF